MNRIELQEISEIRLRESKALLSAGFAEGAYYLAGYAVECALKACIAKRTREHDFPEKKQVNDSHTHDLGKLLNLAELKDELDGVIGADPAMASALDEIQDWSETTPVSEKDSSRGRSVVEGNRRGERRTTPVDTPTLVSYDIENGKEVISALDNDGKTPDVALWAKLPDYEGWRLVIASDRLDHSPSLSGYDEINRSDEESRDFLPQTTGNLLAPDGQAVHPGLAPSLCICKGHIRNAAWRSEIWRSIS